MVNDWLNDRKLDRKALTALANNAAAVEEYHQHVAYEVYSVVQDIVADIAGEPKQVRLTDEPTARDTFSSLPAPFLSPSSPPDGALGFAKSGA
jgi:hypothetical protein